jgi:hypothetical protein
MKKIILVNLLSEQTVPTVISINTFIEAQYHFFLTTEKMENHDTGNRIERVLTACNIASDKYFKRIVRPEDYNDIFDKLEESANVFRQFDEIYANITGGTKIMSLATYNFFTKIKAHIWYLPIGSTNFILANNPLTTRNAVNNLTIHDYFNACGIFSSQKLVNFKQLSFDEKISSQIFSKYLAEPSLLMYAEELRLLFRADNAAYPFKGKKKISISELPERDRIIECVNFFGLELNGDILTKEMLDYITGGWFEEYTYLIIQKLLTCPNDCQIEDYIKIGAQLQPTGINKEKARYFTNNDLDVVFIHKENLYVVECKTAGMEKGDLFNKTVYLQSALRKYFGLSVRSVLFTLSDIGTEKFEKADALGIQIIDRQILSAKDSIDRIKSLLNL